MVPCPNNYNLLLIKAWYQSILRVRAMRATAENTKMANVQPIQKVAKLALETFKCVNRGEKHVFLDKLETLCASMNRIRAADVGVDLTANRASPPPAPATAPVGYMFIAENSTVSMGVFVVERGCRLPLHDHNGMHGVIKVLSGTIRMHSYDLLTEDEMSSVKIPDSDGLVLPVDGELTKKLIPVRRRGEIKITPESKPCVLSPMESNVHSLESVDGPAAFLDVLSPPYNPDIGRDCIYYKETSLSNSKETSVDLRWLQRIPQPSSFWCNQQSYLGPAVNLEQL